MKLAIFLDSWTFAGVACATASQTPTGPHPIEAIPLLRQISPHTTAAIPLLEQIRSRPPEVSPLPPEASPQSSEVHKALLFWDPTNAYRSQRKRKSVWEHACGEALKRKGCGVGKIYETVTSSAKNGEKTSYVRVEGARHPGMHYEKKMRVFIDGSSEDGWPAQPEPPKTEAPKALLLWDPPNAYNGRQQKRKSRLEQACQNALAREGCGFGKIYKGVTPSTKNGQKTSYVKVEGAPYLGTEFTKKMRVFPDGSSENGWDAGDEASIKRAKRRRKARKPLDPEPQEGNTALLLWEPEDTYKSKPKWRAYWEERCHRALSKEDCTVGSLHQGISTLTKPDGHKTNYIKVEVAPTLDEYLENETKQMRVFEDGSSHYGWSSRDRKHVMDARRPRKHKKDKEPPQEGRTPYISWEPADTYIHHPKRKQFWNQTCRQALSKDCNFVKIHKGETKTSVKSQKTSYVMVEGASSMDMENSKKMRVFQDGTFEDGWSARTGTAKNLPPRVTKKYKRPRSRHDQNHWTQNDWTPSAILSWDPPNAYPSHQNKRLLWEKRCDGALTNEACGVGRIHQGESKSEKNGEAYLRVEGAPAPGMEFGKRMRVFHDGSYEDGWSEKDHHLIAETKRKFMARHRPDDVPSDQIPGAKPYTAQLFQAPVEPGTGTEVQTGPHPLGQDFDASRWTGGSSEEGLFPIS